MLSRREHDRNAMGRQLAHHFVAVGGDHAPVSDAGISDALPDPNDERNAGEKSERLAGEAGRAQASWDDGERPHTRRGKARAAAKVTPSKLAARKGARKWEHDQVPTRSSGHGNREEILRFAQDDTASATE